MPTFVQGCLDCLTPMVDMENWGNCPNCEGRNLGPIAIGRSIVQSNSSTVKPVLRFYELKYLGGNRQRTSIIVEAKNTSEARKMLYYYCENEQKTLLTPNGEDFRFWPRTCAEDSSVWNRALTLYIEAKSCQLDKPSVYLARGDVKKTVVKRSLVTA